MSGIFQLQVNRREPAVLKLPRWRHDAGDQALKGMHMRTCRRIIVLALTAITFSSTGSAVAAGFDLIAATVAVDGTAGDWGSGRSATPEPAIEATTPSAEPVIPVETVFPMSSAPTEATISPREPVPTTGP